MTLLQVSDVHASYGKAAVLRGVNLEIDRGEVAVLLGANGAGKTTFLRALSGMIRWSGNMTFDGRPLNGQRTGSVARLGIGHVPQGRGTFTDLTVEDNLRAGGYLRSARRTTQSIARWYEFFPRLGERKGQIAGGLSGGEQQMLAIARALVSEPTLLLMDEPSLGLAPLITRELFDGLAEINRTTGTTMLIVEQNAHLALDIGGPAFVMENGRIAVSQAATSLRGDDQLRRAYLGY